MVFNRKGRRFPAMSSDRAAVHQVVMQCLYGDLFPNRTDTRTILRRLVVILCCCVSTRSEKVTFWSGIFKMCLKRAGLIVLILSQE